MASSAAKQIPFPPPPPTYRFRPTKRELVEFYLLPCARGRDKFPGVLFEDDAAGTALPWDLFERHGVGSEDEAYFIVRGGRGGEAKKPGARARQDRRCDGGGGTWKMQSSVEKCLRVRGERIRVHVSNLNLHLGKGKDGGGGSVGWVMHEYTIAAPPCPSPVKICHIAFSGHGRKRMRVPGGQELCQSGSSGIPPCSGPMLDHGSSSGVAYASGDEESSGLVLTDGDNFQQSPLLGGGSDSQGFPFPSAESEQQVWTTEQQDIVAPQMMVQQESTMPVVQQLSARTMEFWSSIGVDVQSDNSFEQEQYSTGVQTSSWVVVPPNNGAIATTGVQSSSCAVPNNGAMATTGVQSSWVVPNTGAMAGDLDDFCRSILATNVRTNWAAPDFSNVTTTGTLGGGCSLICK